MRKRNYKCSCVSRVALISITALFFSSASFSQGTTKSIISTAGQVSSSATSSVTWTIGEILVSSKSSNAAKVMEGFHALTSNGEISTNIPDVNAFTSFTVHPNPTVDFINLQLPFTAEGVQSIFVIADSGVSTSYDNANAGRVDLSRHPPGMYYILVVDDDDNGYLSGVVKL